MKKIFFTLVVCLWLMAASHALAQGLPDTGQTKCYNNTVEIPCPQPGEAFYGQDAEYVKARSYTDLGNGIVRDNVTGLMWQKATARGSYTWQKALDYCANLELGPYSDWRLPAVNELLTLVDGNIPSPSPTINTAYFPHTKAAWYWSSTTYAGNTEGAWGVNFGYGGDDRSYKTDSTYVRAVRSGQ